MSYKVLPDLKIKKRVKSLSKTITYPVSLLWNYSQQEDNNEDIESLDEQEKEYEKEFHRNDSYNNFYQQQRARVIFDTNKKPTENTPLLSTTSSNKTYYNNPDIIEKEIKALENRNKMIQNRTHSINGMVGEITEIHDLMNDLNELVMDNQPMVDSIENSIEKSKEQTEEGVRELKKASKHQKKHNKTLAYLAAGGVGIITSAGVVLGVLKELHKF